MLAVSKSTRARMTSHREIPLRWWIGVVVLALVLAAGVTNDPRVTVLAIAILLGVLAIDAPASAWVGAALLAALTFKGLASLGMLPSAAVYLDMPLAWGALLVGLLKRHALSPFARRHLLWLAALAAVTVLSSMSTPPRSSGP